MPPAVWRGFVNEFKENCYCWGKIHCLSTIESCCLQGIAAAWYLKKKIFNGLCNLPVIEYKNTDVSI